MMPDIFSSFDPSMFTFMIPLTSLMLTVTFIITLSMFLKLAAPWNRAQSLLNLNTAVIFSQLMRTRSKSLKSLPEIISALFIMIIIINLLGLTPYSLSLSSQLIMTLSMGLPIWMSMIMSSFSLNSKASTAHFLPDGAPDWLNPFLVLIESSSIMVRPLTLSFRLAANMTAGHIVLSLVSTYLSGAILKSVPVALTLMSFTTFYILFEMAICLIQAYIFCLLLSLYSDDHSSQ